MIDIILGRLLDASIQGTVAFAIIGAIVILFRRLPPAARCWLWRLTGLKFLLSLLAVASIPLLAAETTTSNETWIAAPLLDATDPMVHSFPTSPASWTTEWHPVLLVVWLVGVGGILTLRVKREFTCRAKIFRSASISECPLEIAQKVAQSLKLRLPPQIYSSASIHSPLVVGVFRPVVVLPQSMLGSPGELELSLAHEMAHIRRRDLGWQALLSIVGALFWFLPPAHWIGALAKLDAEMACDRLVLDLTRSHFATYSRLLVRLASIGTHSSGALGMAAQTRRHLERRIQAMNLNSRTPRLILVLLTGLVALPALIPWRAIAQEANAPISPGTKLDELAMQGVGFLGDENELGITPEQTKQLKSQGIKAQNEVRAFGQKLEDMKRANVSDKDRFAYDSKIRMPMFRRHHREQWNLLTATQQQRQRELTLQYFGPLILSNSEIANQIGLPDSSRKAIASLSSRYREFMRRQERSRMDRFRGQEIKIRDFTTSEKKRLVELKKSILTASGKQREALKQEYSDLRAKSVRYKPTVFHGNVNDWNVKSANKLMAERRAEFARLSAKAQSLIPNSCVAKWKALQGKPSNFMPRQTKNQAAISYR